MEIEKLEGGILHKKSAGWGLSHIARGERIVISMQHARVSIHSLGVSCSAPLDLFWRDIQRTMADKHFLKPCHGDRRMWGMQRARLNNLTTNIKSSYSFGSLP